MKMMGNCLCDSRGGFPQFFNSHDFCPDRAPSHPGAALRCPWCCGHWTSEACQHGVPRRPRPVPARRRPAHCLGAPPGRHFLWQPDPPCQGGVGPFGAAVSLMMGFATPSGFLRLLSTTGTTVMAFPSPRCQSQVLQYLQVGGRFAVNCRKLLLFSVSIFLFG
eukprot:EG_transcript_36586